MSNILQTIAEYTMLRVEEAKKRKSLEVIKEEALSMNGNTGFPFEKADPPH